MIGLLLVSCGTFGVVLGAWRGYTLAREALSPLIHEGEPTRTAIEATRPVLARPRVRLFVRRLTISIGWIAVALYGLFLASVGLAIRG